MFKVDEAGEQSPRGKSAPESSQVASWRALGWAEGRTSETLATGGWCLNSHLTDRSMKGEKRKHGEHCLRGARGLGCLRKKAGLKEGP